MSINASARVDEQLFFVGLLLGIFATHKPGPGLPYGWGKVIRQEQLRIQFGVLFGWFKRNFSLKKVFEVLTWLFWLGDSNPNRGRKVSPKKSKSKSRKVHIPGDFCSKSRKNRKIRKVENFLTFWLFAKSRKGHIPGDFCSKNRKVEKSKTFWLFARSFAIFALCDYRREERLATETPRWETPKMCPQMSETLMCVCHPMARWCVERWWAPLQRQALLLDHWRQRESRVQGPFDIICYFSNESQMSSILILDQNWWMSIDLWLSGWRPFAQPGGFSSDRGPALGTVSK